MTRHQEIAALILDGASPRQLRDQFPQLAPSTVASYRRQVLRDLSPETRAELRDRRPEPPAILPEPWSARTPLSPLHRRLGIKLASHREGAGQTLTEFVAIHGFANRLRLSALEQGLADPTLSELAVIAELLGTDVAGLLAPVLPRPAPPAGGQCRGDDRHNPRRL